MLTLNHGERHAQQRAAERYGVQLTDELKHRVVREIRRSTRRRPKRGLDDRKAWRLHHSEIRGRERWRVLVDGVQFHVIYDIRERCLVTFLPPCNEFTAPTPVRG